MQIQIRAVHRDGFPGWASERRMWPSDKWATVDVLDQEEDPPDVPGSIAGIMRADPTRIGQQTFARLKLDERLTVRILGVDDVNLEEALAQAKAALEAEKEARAAEVAVLKKRNDELEIALIVMDDDLKKARAALEVSPPDATPVVRRSARK